MIRHHPYETSFKMRTRDLMKSVDNQNINNYNTKEDDCGEFTQLMNKKGIST